MTNTAPSLTSSRIEALLPLARGWLMAMACVLLALVERSGLHRRPLLPFVRRVERMLENWIFLQAHLRATPPLWPSRSRHPKAAPRGFRRQAARGDLLRRATRTRRSGHALAQRLRFVHAIAADPRRAVARIVKRLNEIAACGLISARLVATHPPSPDFAAACAAPAPFCADSS